MKRCQIYVDADACPVKDDVARMAGKRGVPVVFVGNTSQGVCERPDVTTVTVGDSPDAADFEIVTRVEAGDIVVTDDIGLASMVLPKGARCLSSRGKVFDENNIGFLMASRHIGQQIRAAGGRTKGPKPFAAAHRRRFLNALAAMLHAATAGQAPPEA